MLELLAPAGSMDALRAAVQSGANAVYLGSGPFNARQNAKNFTLDELPDAVRYCHVRGVQVHLTLNTLVTDRELEQAAQTIVAAVRAGVDAFIVQDLGLVSLLRQMAPDVPIHASTQMSIHSLDGVLQAAAMGLSRVVLARELSRGEIAYICRNSPIEIEVFVHGALCMCYSGQCYFSAVVGSRSGNRGQCAQPCRLPYGYGRFEEKYPLSLKDNCLISWMKELSQFGVASVKIEGRMKRPEYVAVATRLYRAAIDGQKVSAEEMRELREVFSRQGFTQGYYEGRTGPEMFGTRQKERDNQELLQKARLSYENTEAALVPVRFYAVINARQNAMLAVEDELGNLCKTEGPVPELAVSRALTPHALADRLAKTGGTPYRCVQTKCVVEPGLTLSAAAINAMRRELLSHLTALRGRKVERELNSFSAVKPFFGVTRPPRWTVGVLQAEQLTSKLLSSKPTRLYVPLSVFKKDSSWITRIPVQTELAVVLPRVIVDEEVDAVLKTLDAVRALGVRLALCGNLGHISLARSRGFAVCGDFGLNLFNSRAMHMARGLGLESATASFELTIPRIRDLSKPLPTEMLVYGRLPLMLTENCLIKNRTGRCACESGPMKLVDRKGEEFRVLPDQDCCRSVVYNGKKLYLLDKLPELRKLGLWALRVQFTTENPMEVDTVISALRGGAVFDPGACTRGLYYRGVE
ncbi:MAG: U32 family peptidase [Oscillospiraceae bacterium]|nr:U32 family peptidase [Oscillospiraceae bacterium]